MEHDIKELAHQITLMVDKKLVALRTKPVDDTEFVQEIRRITFMEIAHNILLATEQIKSKQKEDKKE